MSSSHNSTGTYESWWEDSTCYSNRSQGRRNKIDDEDNGYENIAELELKSKAISQDQTPSDDSERQSKSKQNKVPKVTYRESTKYMQSPSSEEAMLDMEREQIDKSFLGVLKEECVGKYLKVNEFRLYYKIPSSGKEITPSLPLQVGYMSSSGTVHHFPVACTNPGTRKQAWFVITGVKEAQIVAFLNFARSVALSPNLLLHHEGWNG
ncbi:hypothetical protein M3Y97_00107100 [Aphelenchoides bicaudatus]|nr:hypothetical protein M3Y97_00107100 [Aphelenchoides bicaudatus]